MARSASPSRCPAKPEPRADKDSAAACYYGDALALPHTRRPCTCAAARIRGEERTEKLGVTVLILTCCLPLLSAGQDGAVGGRVLHNRRFGRGGALGLRAQDRRGAHRSLLQVRRQRTHTHTHRLVYDVFLCLTGEEKRCPGLTQPNCCVNTSEVVHSLRSVSKDFVTALWENLFSPLPNKQGAILCVNKGRKSSQLCLSHRV